MKINKSKFWRVSSYLALLFVVMFVFRFIYGYYNPNSSNTEYFSNFFESIVDVRKNYASEKMNNKHTASYDAGSAIPSAGNIQKFEKSGIVKTKSLKFDDDEKIIRDDVKSFNALIQYEQSMGQKGSRQLHLLIGVSPESFDSMYNKMCTIGTPNRMQVTKEDKTNEYRRLNAQKISLEKTLNSLKQLESKPGAIIDFVALHEKILAIEEQLQGLGVDLGDFEEENEFCTIKLSVYEDQESKISIPQRIKVALEWTAKYYFMIMAGLAFALIAAYFGIRIFSFILGIINK